MFKRLELESWHDFVPVIAFLLTFAVFIFCTIRALRMHRDQAAQLATLPLDEEHIPADPR